MNIAILSRPGDCFPNIISKGLVEMLKKENVNAEVIYDAIPMLMRLLPLSKKTNHWYNNFHFRIRNKIEFYLSDKKILNRLKKFDAIILSECLPNAYWRNYYDIESLKKKLNIPILSYTDNIANAPLHKKMWFNNFDFNENRYFINLVPSFTVEIYNKQFQNIEEIGINISNCKLDVVEKKEFVALLDFLQPGYESYRHEQKRALEKLGIQTIELFGHYTVEEIRELYRKASMFFMSFPETFGLPIAECLSTGCMIFTPSSSWPMAWRLNEDAKPWGEGILPECFQVYYNENTLIDKLHKFREEYHFKETPLKINEIFMEKYAKFYYGKQDVLKSVIIKLKENALKKK
jgi:hypothetical protein